MANKVRLREQVQKNAVALISLAIALSSLGYNTWRNEASEYNRNQRLISIEVLRNLGEFQQVVFHNAWDMDSEDKGNLRTGWVHVLSIRDLAQLLDGPAAGSAVELWQVWDKDFNALEHDNEPYKRVVKALGQVRQDTHALLQGLD